MQSFRTGGIQERSDTEHQGCWYAGKLGWVAAQVGWRTGGIQKMRDAGKEGFRSGGRKKQEWKDGGQVGGGGDGG